MEVEVGVAVGVAVDEEERTAVPFQQPLFESPPPTTLQLMTMMKARGFPHNAATPRGTAELRNWNSDRRQSWMRRSQSRTQKPLVSNSEGTADTAWAPRRFGDAVEEVGRRRSTGAAKTAAEAARVNVRRAVYVVVAVAVLLDSVRRQMLAWILAQVAFHDGGRGKVGVLATKRSVGVVASLAAVAA